MKYDLFIPGPHGHQLEILQELPSKGDTFPTIILVPGFGADLHEFGYFDQVSDRLVKNGFQTIRFSFEGTGKSEGEFVNMSVERQVEQLKSVVEYVLKDRFTDTAHIGLLAQSFGTAITVATLPLPGIHSLLFSSSTANPSHNLVKYFRRQRGFNPKGVSQRERADNTKTKIGPQFWKSLDRHNFVSLIKKVTQPILFIHGSKDQHVKASQSLLYYSAVTAKKRIHLIDQADHAFTGKFRTTVLDLIVDWFEETLR